MNTKDRLKMMLLGPKDKSTMDDAEDRMEAKAGRRPTPKEEMLEDAKGRALKIRIPGNKKRR